MSLASVVVARSGGFLVAPTSTGAQIGRYSERGRFEGAAGRSGTGPGEFLNIRSLAALPSGSLAVLDYRLTLLTPGLTVAAIKTLPAGVTAGRIVSLTDGRLVINNYNPARPALCLFDRDLALVRCFGGTTSLQRTGAYELERQLSAGPDATVWSAPVMYQYVIERWDSLGNRIEALRRSASWFPVMRPEDDPHLSPAKARPLPRVTGLWADDRGQLWTSIIVADEHWSAAAATPQSREGGPPLPLAEWPRYFDTMIEIIDPVGGKVIASQRFPGVFGGFTTNGLLTEFREGADGVLQVVLFRPHVVQPELRR